MNILTKILHAGIFERAVSPPATPVGMGLRPLYSKEALSGQILKNYTQTEGMFRFWDQVM